MALCFDLITWRYVTAPIDAQYHNQYQNIRSDAQQHNFSKNAIKNLAINRPKQHDQYPSVKRTLRESSNETLSNIYQFNKHISDHQLKDQHAYLLIV